MHVHHCPAPPGCAHRAHGHGQVQGPGHLLAPAGPEPDTDSEGCACWTNLHVLHPRPERFAQVRLVPAEGRTIRRELHDGHVPGPRSRRHEGDPGRHIQHSQPRTRKAAYRGDQGCCGPQGHGERGDDRSVAGVFEVDIGQRRCRPGHYEALIAVSPGASAPRPQSPGRGQAATLLPTSMATVSVAGLDPTAGGWYDGRYHSGTQLAPLSGSRTGCSPSTWPTTPDRSSRLGREISRP